MRSLKHKNLLGLKDSSLITKKIKAIWNQLYKKKMKFKMKMMMNLITMKKI